MNALPRPLSRPDSRFFCAVGVGVVDLVLWGFSRTYFLKLYFGSPELPLRLHIHGAVMTTWIVLFFVQICLVATNRVALHRRLGMLSALVAVLVVVVGTNATIHAAAREVQAHSIEAPGRVKVMGLEIVQMALFTGLIGAGFVMRRRRDVHKRLMLLGTACMLPSAIGRLPLVETNLQILLLFVLIVVAGVLADTLTKRSLHPQFAWCALLVVASISLTDLGVNTHQWIEFGTRLVSADPGEPKRLDRFQAALDLSLKSKYE